ncbi:unnamed protein product, partial [Laminaria digitata]
MGVQAAEMLELREKNKTMKDELFRLSQRYSRRMSMMKVDHTRDMVRLSMLDSAGDSTEDSSSSCFGSFSGLVPEEEEQAAPSPPVDQAEASPDRVGGLEPVAANLFASPAQRKVNSRASWGGPRTSPRTGMPPCAPSPISSRDACEASANRRLSGQHMDNVMARQKQLEHAADTERRRLEKVVDRNRALTLDLQRERAERQRLQGHLVAAERGAQGTHSEYLKDTVDALEGVWGEIGLAQDQRLGLMDRVSSGVFREAQNLLEKARDERVSLGAKVGSLREDLRSLWAMLGRSEEVAQISSALAEKPLRAQ